MCGQAPAAGGDPPCGPLPDMPGQWWAVEELDPLDAFDPLLPVLSVDVDDAFDGGLYVALVELVVVDEELLEAA